VPNRPRLHHTLPIHFSEAFAVENAGLPHLHRLRAGDYDDGAPFEAKVFLARYFGVLWGRSPKQRATMNAAIDSEELPAPRIPPERISELVARATITGTPAARRAWDVVFRPLHTGARWANEFQGLIGIAAGARDMARAMSLKRWTVYRRSKDPMFATGTEPVVLSAREAAWREGAHPTDTGTIIAIAVSPERLIVMDHSRDADCSRPCDFLYPELSDWVWAFLKIEDPRLMDPAAWWGFGLAHSRSAELYARNGDDLRAVLTFK
jgi:hypothetical protein